MGYRTALEKAGCNVIRFNEFGSYQGDWLALVEYKGEKGIVHGCYGSCSGCDAFQAQFDYRSDEIREQDGKYIRYWDEEVTKEEYDAYIVAYDKELAEFGESYLSGGLTTLEYWENRKSMLQEDDWFSDEEKEYIDWAINALKN
jgi:hypothetical protein